MKKNARLITLFIVDSFMIVCFVLSFTFRFDPSSAVLCGFAAAFSTYLLISNLVPNREREYSLYKKIYAPHLKGVFKGDNRYFNRLLKVISFLDNINPKIGLFYASKLFNAAKTNKDRAVVNYFCGVCAENSDDLQRARDYYSEATRFDSKYTQAYMRLSIICDRLSDAEMSEKAFALAVSASGKDCHNAMLAFDSATIKKMHFPVLFALAEKMRGKGDEHFITLYVMIIYHTFNKESDKRAELISECVKMGANESTLTSRADAYLLKGDQEHSMDTAKAVSDESKMSIDGELDDKGELVVERIPEIDNSKISN